MAKKKSTKTAETGNGRISVNALEEVINRTYVGAEHVEWNGLDVVIKKTLPLEDMMEFVDSVVKCCFHKDTHAYMPEIYDFALRMNVMEMYANFTLPRNTKLKYEFVMHTDAFEMVREHINPAQYHQMCNAIDKKIENVARANVEMVNKRLNDTINSFNALYDTLHNTFAGVSNEDIQNLTSALANHMPSEGEIAKAYIEAKNEAE